MAQTHTVPSARHADATHDKARHRTSPASTRGARRAKRQQGHHVSTLSARARQVHLTPTYFRAVDGLRAFAILSVLVFHTGIYSNGIFGVDLFFVLSGFLITLTLLREFHRSGSIKIGRFYLRRAKRLLPLLLITLAFSLWAVTRWGSRDELTRFSHQAVSSLLYLTNWEQIAAGQHYWDGFEAINPLGHMWSLAITEQFYLVWPVLLLLVFFLGKRLSRKHGANGWQRSQIAAILVLTLSGAGIVLASLQTAFRFDGTNADRMYLGTDTHFVGLVAGAAAAALCYLSAQRSSLRLAVTLQKTLAQRVWSAVVVAAVTVSSTILIIAIVVLSVRATSYDQPWLYQYGFTAIAVLGSLLTLTLTSSHNLLVKLFSFALFVELGKVSYTLFLIHMPVFWMIRTIEPQSSPWDIFIIGIPASILLASGLHHLVAEPIRLRTWHRKGVTVLVSSIAAVGAAALLIPAVALVAPSGNGDIRVLTLGDSLANDFASALSHSSVDVFTVYDGGLPGCGISGSSAQRIQTGHEQSAPKSCNPWQDRWSERIAMTQPDVIVANIAWDAVTQQLNGEWSDLTDEQFAAEYRVSLEEFADVTTANGSQVLLANSRLYNGVVTPEQAVAFNNVIADFLADHPEIRLLDLHDEACDDRDCSTLTETGEPRYIDNRVHFSDAGKLELAPWLTSEILTATRSLENQPTA